MGMLTKFLLVATAFAPVLLVYGGVLILEGEQSQAVWSFAACALLVGTCTALVQFSKTRLTRRNYTTKTVESADGEVSGFLLIYLLPLITRNIADYNWIAWGIVALIFCVVFARSFGFHFNPLLVLLGYHFYRVTEESGLPHVLVTRRRIFETGETLKVTRPSEYMLIETARASSARGTP